MVYNNVQVMNDQNDQELEIVSLKDAPDCKQRTYIKNPLYKGYKNSYFLHLVQRSLIESEVDGALRIVF